MPTTPAINVKVSVDTSRFREQIDSLLEPLTWRHRFVAWLAAGLGVDIEIKRTLRGFRRFRGGYI